MFNIKLKGVSTKVFGLLICLGLLLSGCASPVMTVAPVQEAPGNGLVSGLNTGTDDSGKGLEEAVQPPRRETITLTAVGDILMHNTLIWSGEQKDGSYDFDFFAPIKALIEEGDYASTNLEAALAGPASGYTGYPQFNSPDEVASNLQKSGFDLVVTANNHVLDRGYQGALRTLDVLRKTGLDTLGVYKSQEESESLLIKDIRGVKVGYLAYTYGTNGLLIPKEAPYLVNLLDKNKILADIAKMRAQVDILVLVMHWGVEYSPQPSAEQKQLAHELLDAGADVILGSHPHVIQPMEVVKSGGKNKFVIYSMGNSVGDQRGVERNSGVVLKLKFTKDFAAGETLIDELSYTPIFSHSYYLQGKQKFRVVPLESVINEVKSARDPYLKVSDLPLLEQALKLIRKQLGENYRLDLSKENY